MVHYLDAFGDRSPCSTELRTRALRSYRHIKLTAQWHVLQAISKLNLHTDALSQVCWCSSAGRWTLDRPCFILESKTLHLSSMTKLSAPVCFQFLASSEAANDYKRFLSNTFWSWLSSFEVEIEGVYHLCAPINLHIMWKFLKYPFCA